MFFYVILALIIITFLALVFKYWDFRSIILKNFFKARGCLDFLEILFILISSTFLIFFLCALFVSYDPHDDYSCANDPRLSYKKSIAILSQAMIISKQLNSANANNCEGCHSNKQALANFFIKRLNVVESYDSSSKKLQKKLHKDELLKNPYFLCNDGTLYIIEKAQGKCGDTNTTDPNKANCVIVVDINGHHKPNQFSTGNNKDNYKLNDRFRIIVLKDSVAPASSAKNNVAEYILYN